MADISIEATAQERDSAANAIHDRDWISEDKPWYYNSHCYLHKAKQTTPHLELETQVWSMPNNSSRICKQQSN